jgi:hypothetical protein
MSRIIQFKRYGTAALANTIGANGELIIDVTTRSITIHDGVTAGGFGAILDVFSRATSNLAYAKANSANVLAQTAFDKANSANVLAQTAFDRANSANFLAQTAFDRANSANILAQAAFTQANTSAQTVPQNAQTTDYTLQLSDAGKHIYYTQSSNTILYIPTTSNVAFSNGTTIMIVSSTSSSANVTVSPNTGVSMYLAGNTTSASRNVTTYGVATLMQVAANTWFINGTGVV